MNVATEAASAAAETVTVVPVETPESQDRTPISASEAARQLANWRVKKQQEAAKQSEAPAAPEGDAEPQKSAVEADAAPPEEATGETQAIDPVQEEQPLELPRSWAKDKSDVWAKLDRAAQEYLLEHDSKASAEVRRSQNEAAEKSKALETKLQQAEQTRQQYEAALPALQQALTDVHQGEFADIKTMADVEKLAREDWPRYVLWDAQQKKIAAVRQEIQVSQERQASEHKKAWTDFAAKQDQLLVDRAPELADKTRAAKIADSASSLLKDVGFTDQELSQLWNGEASISLRDHRMQLLLLDGVKYREAKTAKPAPKPVPPVQRPGVSKVANAADDAIQALKASFERNPTPKTAAALRAAERRAAS